MKKIILSVIILMLISITQNLDAEDEKTVTLTVEGRGTTLEEAKQSALRSAIEQAFGTFISSKTEILNGELIADEISSVSSGNIKDFSVISETVLPNNEYVATLKTTVSVTNLTSFVKSKGIEVEFKGSLFSFNIKQQKLNEENELKVINDMCETIKTIANVSFDYEIKVKEPVKLNDFEYDEGEFDGFPQKLDSLLYYRKNLWSIRLILSVYPNNNFLKIPKYMLETLQGLSLTKKEAEDYINLNKKVCYLYFGASEDKYDRIIFRKKESCKQIIETMNFFRHALSNFVISNGVDRFRINPEQNKRYCVRYIWDYGFRIISYGVLLAVEAQAAKRFNAPSVEVMGDFRFSFFWASTRYRPYYGNVKKLGSYERDSTEIRDPGYWPPKTTILDSINVDGSVIHTCAYFSNIFKDKYLGCWYNNNSSIPDNHRFSRQGYYTPLPLPYDGLEKEADEINDNMKIRWEGRSDYHIQGLDYKNLKYNWAENYLKQFYFITDKSDLDFDLPSDAPRFVISFIGIKPGEEAVRFYFDDIRHIDEINQISGYKIRAIGSLED